MGLDRGIWFAGEATAPFVALGTVTGAYLSGEIVAKKIASLYGPTEGELMQDYKEPEKDTVDRGVHKPVPCPI